APDYGDDIVSATSRRPFTRVPAKPGAERVPPTGPVPPGRASEADAHVDSTYTSASPEAREEIKRVYRDNPDLIESQVRGEQSWARTRALAERTAFDPEDVVPGMNPNAEETLAARNLSASLSEKVADARAALRDAPNDPEVRRAMTKAHSDFVRATIAVRGFRAEQGRALNALKITPSTSARTAAEGRF